MTLLPKGLAERTDNMLSRNAVLGLIIAIISHAHVVHASGMDSQRSVYAVNSDTLTLASTSSQSALFVDVRSWVEYQVDGIADHTHIHYPDIADQIGQYANSKDQLVYVYCAVGARAENARQALLAEGYTRVVNLGGIDEVKRQIEMQGRE